MTKGEPSDQDLVEKIDKQRSHSYTIGRRKASSISFSLQLVMLLLSATNIVHARPRPRAYRKFGIEDASKTDSQKLYNLYYEEFRNVHHRIFKRRASYFEFDNAKKAYDTYETDIVDREDHVTQYLTESLVNTDNEITSLEGSDVEPIEDETPSPPPVAKDRFFLFLTEEEGVQEIDSVLSQPARTILRESEMYPWL